MGNSDYIFEEGDPITVGNHGEHDFLFSDGEPVLDGGDSGIVFEEGTGLGGANALFWRFEPDDGAGGGLSTAADLFEEEIGAEVTVRDSYSVSLDTALDEDTYTLLLITTEQNSDDDRQDLTSGEKAALSEWWENDAVQGLAYFSEHRERRARAGNDIHENTVGGRPWVEGFDGYERTGSDGCTTNVPTGYYPPLNGIEHFWGENSEGNQSDPGTSEEGFITYDPDTGPRVWGDGTYTRVGDASIGDCDDTTTYIRQVALWLNRSI